MLIFIIIVRILIFVYPYSVIKKLPSHIKTIEYHQINKNIPMIIYRTHKTSYVNGRMFKECHTKWSILNPKYQIIWFNQRTCNIFMQNLDQRIYNAYNKLKPGAFKADLWRLCILYEYGGIYIDSYATPFKSLDEIIPKFKHQNNVFMAVLDPQKCGGGVHNGFIISTKKHPFLLQCIEDIVQNVETDQYYNSPLEITGPLCLKKSIQKVLNKYTDFKIGWNRYSNLSFYLLEFEIGPYQYVKQEGKNVLSKKYSFMHYLYQKNMNKKESYSLMWKNKDIYTQNTNTINV